MKNYKALQNLISSIEADARKFYDSGNKAAGTRLRKAMLDIKKLAQDIRNEVSELKKKEA
jgi:archaellum component FlaC